MPPMQSRPLGERRPLRWFLPPIMFHDKARHRLRLLFLEDEAFALVPAPGLLVLTHAAKMNFVGQMRSREGEQTPTERTALIGGRYEQLVEITFRQVQCEHRGERTGVVGDEQAPAVFDFPRHAGT